MPLTDLALRNAKPKDKPYKLFDGGGLHLLVNPNGSRIWRLAYRFAGKPKQLSFGPYPTVSLAEARQKREEAKKQLLGGEDPSAVRKLEKVAASVSSANTFAAVAEEFIERLRGRGIAEITLAKKRWLLADLAGPSLGHRPISEISAFEVLSVLQQIERSGRRETARRLRSSIGAVFRFAIATLRAENDPTFALRDALERPQVRHISALTDPKALGGLLRAVDEYTGWPTVRSALLFTALTFARPGEVRGARWSEIDFEKAVWSIPAERMKMRRAHMVPLSRQAVAVLNEIRPLTGSSELVFPSIRSNKKLLSENAMNSALRRMGFTQDEMTSHGFRAAASSILNEKGHSPDVIEAALGHLDSNEVRRAYNRATYWPERVVLLQVWADLLDEFRAMKGQRA
ncbi:tyrosine-type recombinase/integrase [Xanthobacter dioxanivorans]|uniref:Tyrosine-type recombinase/integrase n=1 Tax=Xanthobacter dioxanivorans TaxID=2528964 RepID=A0A974SKY8_9HYPH|nr:integrase arm-type DNA-binding domain-containing protein [Xanthobacter dioxanivorans]QRG08724.1 tyrosine-type recombinase/integrase [Xanthobacter dioxanivorans]